MTSRNKYLSSYQSPNINIVPTIFSNPPPLKKIKIDNILENTHKLNTINVGRLKERVSQDIKSTQGSPEECLEFQQFKSNRNETGLLGEMRDIDSTCLIKRENEVNQQILNKTIRTEHFINTSDNFSNTNFIFVEDNIISSNKNIGESIIMNTKNCSLIAGVFEPKINSETRLPDHSCNDNNIKKNCYGELLNITKGTKKNIACERISNSDNKLGNNFTTKSIKFENDHYNNIEIPNKKGNRSSDSSTNFKPFQIEQKCHNAKEVEENIETHKSAQELSQNLIQNNIVKNIKDTETLGKSIEIKHKNKANKKKIISSNINTSKKKTKQSKKIKITINVTYNNLHGENKSTANTDFDGIYNPDLSFLDDFDIDEVVESLYSAKDKNNSLKSDEEKNIVQCSKIPKNLKKGCKELTKINNEESCLHYTLRDENGIKQHNFMDINDNNLPLNDGSVPQVDSIDRISKINTDEKATKCLKLKRKNIQGTKISCNVSKILDATCKNSPDCISYKRRDQPIKVDNIYMDENTIKIEKNAQEIAQGILKDKFVTNYDKILACQLEMKMNDTLKEKYSVIAVTHYGKFSKIFKCANPSGEYFAVKILDNPASYNFKEILKDNMLNELKQDIPKENLTCVFLLNSFKLNGCWSYMMDFYPNNLEQVLESNKKIFSINQIRHLAKQLVEAVVVLRNNKIVHHDIKPSHILLDSKLDMLRLCGFDEAHYYNHSDNLPSNIGTINYCSPEKILGHSHGYSVDIWSTALVIFEMATNSKLFMGKTSNEILYKQMNIFGNLPEQMIKESRFKKAHFDGITFIKRGLTNVVAEKRINHFEKCGNISTSISSAQSIVMGEIGRKEHKRIISEIELLSNLLEKMLAMDPRKRITIELHFDPLILRDLSQLFYYLRNKSSLNIYNLNSSKNIKLTTSKLAKFKA